MFYMFSWFKNDIKMVCFDIDNTLCDYMGAEAQTEAYIIEVIFKDIRKLQSKNRLRSKDSSGAISKFTLLRMLTDIKNSYVHKDLSPQHYSRELWFKELFERSDLEMNLGISMNSLIRDAKDYETKYWKYFDSRLKNYPNTLFTLETLKSSGLKLASVSDSDGKAGIKLGRIKVLGLDKYFDYNVTSDYTGENKPAVSNWELVLKLSGLKAKDCMMVGDHPDVDLVNAKKMGFRTVWTKEGIGMDLHYRFVDYEIKDIKELIGIVEKINER